MTTTYEQYRWVVKYDTTWSGGGPWDAVRQRYVNESFRQSKEGALQYAKELEEAGCLHGRAALPVTHVRVVLRWTRIVEEEIAS